MPELPRKRNWQLWVLPPERPWTYGSLGRIANTHGIEITLFFEEDLARTRSFASVEEEFGSTPEYERPYISVTSFLRFTRENDPSFEQTMDAFPLMIEIVSVGERPSGKGNTNCPLRDRSDAVSG